MITPHSYVLLSSNGESDNKLNAFDSALQSAGVADFNYITVSSILPVGCKRGEPEDIASIKAGSFMYCVMSKISSDVKGETISSAIACAKTLETVGLISEYSGHCQGHEAERRATDMVRTMAKARGATIGSVETTSTELTVEECGCCVSLCLLLY